MKYDDYRDPENGEKIFESLEELCDEREISLPEKIKILKFERKVESVLSF